ncbi:MAG: TetR family transcriptional regulator [Ktedonobacterales bacterium]
MARTVDIEARDARKQAILDAAIRALARDGVAASTTRSLAAAAEVNQATLLYYFESKDALLAAALQELMRHTRELVLAAASSALDLRIAIAESLRAFWSYVEREPELEMMQQELTLYALRSPDSAWLAREQYAGYCAVVAAIFVEAFATASQSCVVPFDALARFAIADLDGMILQFLSDRDVERARRDLDLLIAAVIALCDLSV